MALVYQETRAEAVCSLEQDVLVLLNDKSRMKGDLHVRFREKFEVKVLLLTRLRGRELITPSYSIYRRIFCKCSVFLYFMEYIYDKVFRKHE